MKDLWITYAWSNNSEGDFDFLVQVLESVGVKTRFDRVALIPGQKLWEQIGKNISKSTLSGWAYLLTEKSIKSRRCQEELEYALHQALIEGGEDFPLIGLLHGVAITDVPAPLVARLCISLNSANWKEEVKAAIEKRAPNTPKPVLSRFVGKIHKDYNGQQGISAIEMRPRFGELNYWVYGFPVDGPQPVQFGRGPSNGGGIGPMSIGQVTGSNVFANISMSAYGTSDPLSPSLSAYATFDGDIPSVFFFGERTSPYTLEAQGVICRSL